MFGFINTIMQVINDTAFTASRADDTKAVVGTSQKFSKRLATGLDNIANANTRRRYKSPIYNNVYTGTKKAFSTILSGKTARTIGVGLAGFAFATSLAFPPVAITLATISAVGYTASVLAQTIQKRNLRKVKDEEKSLERLIKHKHRSIEHAHTLGITPDLAKKIGLNSLLLPTDNSHKLSKISREDLLVKLKSGKITADERKKLARLNAEQVSSQKNEDGKTSTSKSILKTIRTHGLEWAGNVSTAAANIANPVGLTIAIGSTVASFVGERRERHEVSNQKQALKSAIEHFRKRPDVPGYDSLDELYKEGRKAKLEAKALAKLAGNKDFAEAVKAQNIALLSQMIIAAKHEYIIEERAIKESKELKTLYQMREKSIKQDISKHLSENYDELEKQAKSALKTNAPQKDVLKAMHEIARHIVTEAVDSRLESKKELLIDDAIGKAKLRESISPDKKQNLIANYEGQDQQKRWQKVKQFFSDIGESLNIFKKDILEVKDPHRLLTSENFQKYAIHKKEHQAAHQQDQTLYHKQTIDIVKVAKHITQALKIEEQVKNYFATQPSSTPTVAHQSSLQR